MGHHHAACHTPDHTCGGDTTTATDHLARARGATATGDAESADTEGADLLHRAQSGDRLAFEHLYRRYVGNVQRYVIVRMRDWDRDAVPDLVQDTFCIALAELHAADPDVLGWLIGLAAKACTRHQWALRRYLRAAWTVGEVAERAATQQVPASGNPAGAAAGRPAFAAEVARGQGSRACTRTQLASDHQLRVGAREARRLPRPRRRRPKTRV